MTMHYEGCWDSGPKHYECAVGQVERDEALLREALYALEYANDMTKPEDLQGCECPICTNITALRERLDEGEQR